MSILQRLQTSTSASPFKVFCYSHFSAKMFFQFSAGHFGTTVLLYMDIVTKASFNILRFCLSKDKKSLLKHINIKRSNLLRN